MFFSLLRPGLAAELDPGLGPGLGSEERPVWCPSRRHGGDYSDGLDFKQEAAEILSREKTRKREKMPPAVACGYGGDRPSTTPGTVASAVRRFGLDLEI